MTAVFSCADLEIDNTAYDNQIGIQGSVNENEEISRHYNTDSGESYWFDDTCKNLPVVTDTFEAVYIE